ncbi:toxin ETX [Brevibacillus laterosporus]|uniref:ETX/MTX2 family pore-forming toxin n=1 Tax=Brevibacillus laterosporus TaxID=1465 RepID=UPI000CE4E976|nr:ETX/MTX2 family pore-forming toxin [Brevibacillus laterosporus]PPA86553.1 toxin ETX [Brevibacillus laterosporus]
MKLKSIFKCVTITAVLSQIAVYPVTSYAVSNIEQNSDNKKVTEEKSDMLGNGSLLNVHESSVKAAYSSNVTNVDEQMNKISDFYYQNNLAWKEISTYYLVDQLKEKKTTMSLDLNASDINNLTYNDLQPEYIGEKEFENKTDQEQTFTTAPYSHTVTDTVSSTVTNGFKIGGSGDTIFKIPILLKDGIKLSAEFNSATSTTNTTTDTKTLTAPSQNIKVPAGKTYKVEVNLQKKNFAGDIDFTGKATNVNSKLTVNAAYVGPGFPRLDKEQSFTYATADMWKDLTNDQRNQITGISFDNNKNLTLNGKAKIEGIYGSKLQVSVYDITNNAHRLVQVF